MFLQYACGNDQSNINCHKTPQHDCFGEYAGNFNDKVRLKHLAVYMEHYIYFMGTGRFKMGLQNIDPVFTRFFQKQWFFFLTMGDYDMVAIYEAPDDAVAARFNLQLGMLGNIRTRTLKAFPEVDYREVINSLG